MAEFAEAPQKIMAAVSAIRQRESLSAAITLAESGMGHLGVMNVRPACDEYLWLSYISGLASSDARELLLALNYDEMIRSVNAQWAYLGDQSMVDIGFPCSFLSSLGDVN